MTGVVLGILGFFVVFWVDAVSLKRKSFAKPLLWFVAAALFGAGLVLAIRQPPHVALPVALAVAGWVVTAAGALLIIYSLFVEIPFVTAYVRKGQPLRLVTRGTYALCRHPGVLWLALFLAGLFLASGSLWLLVALPTWVALDILYVVLQERLFFLRMFGAEYEKYQRTVPMLLPTMGSIRECAHTIFRPGTD